MARSARSVCLSPTSVTCKTLLEGIPPAEMNTSMTINATAAWLLALYVANAESQGVAADALRGTTQNDIVKEYLSRGTYIFPPPASRRLIVDMVAWCANHAPKWNPINVCSYHLQEAGATPVQEIAYALATAIGVLDAVRDSGQVAPGQFDQVYGSISFFVNAGIRFVEEMCKLRAFTELWDRIGIERYGVTDERARRFRYGVQVNSLGLTEAQPENNVQRIVLEMLAVTLSKRARARSIQLPAWNEALGLPRPWDQQWSLRMQQVLAFETDLLEHDDIFDGSTVIESLTTELADAAWEELTDVLALGGVFEAIDELKGRLVRSMVERTRRIESGQQEVVGVNVFTETAESPLGQPGHFLTVDPRVEAEAVADVRELARSTATSKRWSPRSPRSPRPPPTRPTSWSPRSSWRGSGGRRVSGLRRCEWCSASTGHRPVLLPRPADAAASCRLLPTRVKAMPGGPPRFLVAKPGLDGHSNGAEQIAVAARDAGMEVVYSGIRLTPAQIVASARDEDPDVIGLSILSGSHLELVPLIVRSLREEGVDAPVIVGGIIPEDDRPRLAAAGVAAVYTPRDFQLAKIMADIVDLVAAHRTP